MRLREAIGFDGAEFIEEGNARIVKNVVMLGPVSSHGYEYTQEAMGGAVSKGLYEGCRIFINHSKEGRDLMCLAGVFRNTRHEGGKVKGDAHLLDDPYGSKFWQIARTMPEAGSCSHVADGRLTKRDDGRKYVEEITRVYSVDLVVSGATTRSVFESDTIEEIPRPEPKERQFDFISRCTGIMTGANPALSPNEAMAVCYAAWTARFEEDPQIDINAIIEAARASETKPEVITSGSEPRKETVMPSDNLSQRIADRVSEIDAKFVAASNMVDPVYRDAIIQEVQAEQLAERERQREQNRKDMARVGGIAECAAEERSPQQIREAGAENIARVRLERKHLHEEAKRIAAEVADPTEMVEI